MKFRARSLDVNTKQSTRRPRIRIGALGSAAALVFAGQAATSAAPRNPSDAVAPADLVTASVELRGMTLVTERGVLTGPSLAPSEREPAVSFEITAPASEIDALVARRITNAGQTLNRSERPRRTFDATPFKSEQLEGTCGWSWVELRAQGSQTQGQAYVKAGFQLAGVSTTSAYNTDVLVYSNATLDLWTGHLKDSGELKGKTFWEKSTRFTVPKTQDYGAHFYVGTVAVAVGSKKGICYTKGPRVDNVKIWVSKK